MNIEEAIEVNKKGWGTDKQMKEARQLGIEALERIKGERDKLQDISKYDVPTIMLPKWLELLPSETE